MGKQNKPLFPDVIVDGQTIASADIAAEAQNHAAPQGKPGLAWRAAARALVVRKLLLNAANKAGLDPEPELLSEDLQETDDEAKIRAYLDENLVAEDFSHEHCRAIYEANPDQYYAPDLYQASHILLAAKAEDQEKRDAAKLAAQGLLKTILGKPKEFGRLAKTHSDCPSGQNNGQLGQLSKGDTVPEFESVLDSLSSGEICAQIVETRFGIHIIRLDEKAVGQKLPFDAVKANIYEALEKTTWAAGAKRLVAELVKNATIDGVDMDPAKDPKPAS